MFDNKQRLKKSIREFYKYLCDMTYNEYVKLHKKEFQALTKVRLKYYEFFELDNDN